MTTEVPEKYELVTDAHSLAERFLKDEEDLVDQLTYEEEIDDIVASGGDRLAALRDQTDYTSELLAKEDGIDQYFSDNDELGEEYLSARGTTAKVISEIVRSGDRSFLDPYLLDTNRPLPTDDTPEVTWFSASGLWVGFWALMALFIGAPLAGVLGIGYRGTLTSLALGIGATLVLTVGREAYYRWHTEDAPAFEGNGSFDPLARVKWTSIVNGISFVILALGVISVGLDAFGTFIGSAIAVVLIATVAMVIAGGIFGYLAGSIGAAIGALLGLALTLWWYSGNITSYVTTTPYLGVVAPGVPASNVFDLLLVTLALAGLIGSVLFAFSDLPATFWRAYAENSASPAPGIYSFLLLTPLFGFGWSLLLAQDTVFQGGVVSEGLFLSLSVAPAIVGAVYVLQTRRTT